MIRAGKGKVNLGRCLPALLTLALFCLGGCAGNSAKQLSPLRLQAISHNQRGVEQEAGGRRDAALEEFSQALRLQSSIENTDGMIVALVNIARTQRLKGDLSAARQAIENAAALLREPSDLASELYFERAKVLLAAGELTAAGEWALRSEAAERGSGVGRRTNLVATILLRQGLPDRALEQAEKALKLNQADGLAAEEANSQRLLGEVHLAKGRGGRAAACYGAALSLDKELSFGRKIADDLRGLGSAGLQDNDLPKAIGFYRRALEVSLNCGDTSLVLADMDRLSAMYRQSGESGLAEKIDGERKKLLAK
jgi:tetratricopeptide (TPR) repeat protein